MPCDAAVSACSFGRRFGCSKVDKDSRWVELAADMAFAPPHRSRVDRSSHLGRGAEQPPVLEPIRPPRAQRHNSKEISPEASPGRGSPIPFDEPSGIVVKRDVGDASHAALNAAALQDRFARQMRLLTGKRGARGTPPPPPPLLQHPEEEEERE